MSNYQRREIREKLPKGRIGSNLVIRFAGWLVEQLVFQCFEFVEIGDNCRDAESLTFRAKVELHLSTAKPNARKKQIIKRPRFEKGARVR